MDLDKNALLHMYDIYFQQVSHQIILMILEDITKLGFFLAMLGENEEIHFHRRDMFIGE